MPSDLHNGRHLKLTQQMAKVSQNLGDQEDSFEQDFHMMDDGTDFYFDQEQDRFEAWLEMQEYIHTRQDGIEPDLSSHIY